jgi:subtilisin family serine protease
MLSRSLVLVFVASIALSTWTAGPPAAAAIVAEATPAVLNAQNDPARYVVQLKDAPLALYAGGVAGLAPTMPAAIGATRLDPSSAASVAYYAYLDQRHAAAIAAIGAALGRSVNVAFHYRSAFNGLAVTLTSSEAATVARVSGVRRVERDENLQTTTDNGPKWMNADEVWDGSATGTATKGEGVVAGIIDTGVNADHPSFADVGGDGYDHSNPRVVRFGVCAVNVLKCNDKLIGMYDFTGTGFEDDAGHGSHTASTVAGNVVDATLYAPTTTLGPTRISGVAPHANLITYKACDRVSGGCRGISLTAAIDQATADAVDVINFSIGGGSQNPWSDSNAEGFLGARDAGIFVSASAGNSGPKPETLGSPSNAPWVMSVGASTHTRKFVNSLVDMSGGATAAPADIAGKGVTSGYGPARVVYAGDYGSPLCGEGPAVGPNLAAAVNPFEPGTFNGEIVVCDRGTYGRIEKAENVKEGGAGGFILANDAPSGNSTVGDAYPLPGANISYADGNVLKAWLDAGSGHTGSITGTVTNVDTANADIMASFSSRGPDKSSPNVLKPDVTAPGVDILAAINTVGNTTSPLGSPEFGVLSGTSMSSPHSAGAAALVRALHPDWTPAEVQSALMMTGYTAGVRKEDGFKAATPFDRGAGRVDLTQAGRAGLVLNETLENYLAAGPDPDGNPDTADGGDPTMLNTASLADADCRGTCTWTRVVETTLGASTTWTARVTGPRGVRVSVQPTRFTIAPGGRQTITVTADVVNAVVGQWSFGELSLTAKGTPALHMPLAVYPGGMSQPVDITTAETTGSHTVTATSDIAIDRFSSVVSGLTEGKVVDKQVPQSTSGGVPVLATGVITVQNPYAAVVGTFRETIEVPEGARFITAEITRSTAPDVDLFIGLDLDGDGPELAEEQCRSASEIALEKCTLRSPAAGTWWILVQNWAASERLIDDIQLTAAAIPSGSNGNLTVTGPSTSIPAGQSFPITLTWNEPMLEPGDAWFALVEYGTDSRHPNNAGSLFVKLARLE